MFYTRVFPFERIEHVRIRVQILLHQQEEINVFQMHKLEYFSGRSLSKIKSQAPYARMVQWGHAPL